MAARATRPDFSSHRRRVGYTRSNRCNRPAPDSASTSAAASSSTSHSSCSRSTATTPSPSTRSRSELASRKDKRAFYVAAVEEAARQLIEETDIDAYGEGPEPAPDGQRAALKAFIDYVKRHRSVYTFLLRSGIGTDPEAAEIIEATREALVARMLSRLSRFGARPDDPATRVRLRGWLGFIEAVSLDWAERQELDADSLLELLVDMSRPVFAAVLTPTVP